MPDDFNESDRQKTHRHSRRGRQLRSVDRSHQGHPFPNDMQRRNSVAVDVQQVRALSGEGQIPSLSRTDASLAASGAAGQRSDDEAAGGNADGERLRQAPFRRTGAVLAYLARYAIANSRMIRLDDLGVPFHHKDYRRDGRGIA
jgi:hypothetical protein